MRIFIPLIFCVCSFICCNAQVLYDNNDDVKGFNTGWSSGAYERGVDDPAGGSGKASRYVRAADVYDVLILNPRYALDDVSAYLNHSKKISIDVYSEHAGTEILLVFANALKSNAAHPIGRHSEYRATTNLSGQWETLEFDFIYQPDNTIGYQEINQMIFLFDPEVTASNGHTYYFNNFYGPEISEPEFSQELYENGDDVSLLTYEWSAGTLTRGAANPAPDIVNPDIEVVQYTRSTGQWDGIGALPSIVLANVEPYVLNRKKMTIQVYSAHPGTQITLVFQNQEKIAGNAHPIGRHSEYAAFTTLNNEWETIEFDFMARHDVNVSDIEVDQLVFLVAPNTFTTRTIYFDNFYGPERLQGEGGSADLALNELVSSNSGTVADFEGDYEDWIEIYNYGSSSADLSGYYLSDNLQNPQKWTFPNVVILPGQYLLVWASGKDRVMGNGEVHTNFRISSSGEPLIFTSPEGNLIDHVATVELQPNYSYGRQPDAHGDWSFFKTPTPRASNTTQTFTEIISSKPVFSHLGGFYESPFNLSVQGPSGAQIRYTLDGSIPTASSPVLNGLLPVMGREGEANTISEIRTSELPGSWDAPNGEVFKAMVIRARVFKEGAIPGPVATNTYFIGSNVSQRYNVAVLSFATDNENLFNHDTGIYVSGKVFEDWTASNPPPYNGSTPANYNQRGEDWERPASLEFFEPDGSRGFSLNSGIRIHGGWSRAIGQKSLRVYFRNTYDTANTLNYPLFPGLK
ncbi:MAG: lamin tail domain-containing protein, partial [Cytophagaceae bacterium]